MRAAAAQKLLAEGMFDTGTLNPALYGRILRNSAWVPSIWSIHGVLLILSYLKCMRCGGVHLFSFSSPSSHLSFVLVENEDPTGKPRSYCLATWPSAHHSHFPSPSSLSWACKTRLNDCGLRESSVSDEMTSKSCPNLRVCDAASANFCSCTNVIEAMSLQHSQ